MAVNEVPVWKKYALSIPEAIEYFNIGERKLRQLIQEHIDDGIVLQNGVKCLIKREKFEEFLNETNSL